MIEARPNDRVLLLGLLPYDEVRSLAGTLSHGIAVCAVASENLHEVRRELRDFENVMVIPVAPEDPIPWRDEFFSCVYAPGLSDPSAEVLRVLTTGGTVWLAGGPITKR